MDSAIHSINTQTSISKEYFRGLEINEILTKYIIYKDKAVNCWVNSLIDDEEDYMYLIKECNLKPQEARSVLPNDCKTEIMITGFVSDWQHFFELRCSNAAHPDARALAEPLKESLII